MAVRGSVARASEHCRGRCRDGAPLDTPRQISPAKWVRNCSSVHFVIILSPILRINTHVVPFSCQQVRDTGPVEPRNLVDPPAPVAEEEGKGREVERGHPIPRLFLFVQPASAYGNCRISILHRIQALRSAFASPIARLKPLSRPPRLFRNGRHV